MTSVTNRSDLYRTGQSEDDDDCSTRSPDRAPSFFSAWAKAEGQLGTNKLFECSFVLDDDCRTLYLDELFLLEIAKEPRDSFP